MDDFSDRFMRGNGKVTRIFREPVEDCYNKGVSISPRVNDAAIIAGLYGNVSFSGDRKIFIEPDFWGPEADSSGVKVEIYGLKVSHRHVGPVSPWTVLGTTDGFKEFEVHVAKDTSKIPCWGFRGYINPETRNFVDMETGEYDFFSGLNSGTGRTWHREKITRTVDLDRYEQKKCFLEFAGIEIGSAVRLYQYEKLQIKSRAVEQIKWVLWSGVVKRHLNGRQIEVFFSGGSGRYRVQKSGSKRLGNISRGALNLFPNLQNRNELRVNKIVLSGHHPIPNPPF